MRTYIQYTSDFYAPDVSKPAVSLFKTSLVGPRRVRQLGGENLVSAAQTAYLMEVQRLLAESLAADEAECHGAKRGKIMDHHGIMDLLMGTVIGTQVTNTPRHASTWRLFQTYFNASCQDHPFPRAEDPKHADEDGDYFEVGQKLARWIFRTFQNCFSMFFFSQECLIFEIFDIIWRFDVHWGRASVRCRFQE